MRERDRERQRDSDCLLYRVQGLDIYISTCARTWLSSGDSPGPP